MPPDKSTKIETVYPKDPAGIPGVYSNHVNIHYLPEEVYLDFSTIQIQSVQPSEVEEDGLVQKLPAVAHTRVVLWRG